MKPYSKKLTAIFGYEKAKEKVTLAEEKSMPESGRLSRDSGLWKKKLLLTGGVSS